MARPLVFVTIFYVLGIILGRYYFSLPLSILLGCVALAWALFNLFSAREGLQSVVPLLIIFLAAGSLALNLSLQQVVGSVRGFSGERCTLIGMVQDEPLWRGDDVVFPLRSEKLKISGEEYPVSGTVWVTLCLMDFSGGTYDGDIASFLTYGQKISLQGVLREPAERRNPGGFDYRFFLETQGMSATFSGAAKDVAPLGISEDLSRLRQAALQVKEKMSGVLRAYLPEREGGLLVGMLFGERKALDPCTEQIFRASGVSHLLAVSGLHVGLIAAFLFVAGQRLGLKGWQAFLFTLLLLFCYIYICGLKPAMLRAFVMVLMGMGAAHLGRSKDFLTALAFAALVTLFYNPLLLFAVGFQLSYAATLSIILFAPVLTEKISALLNRAAPFLPSSLSGAVSALAAVTVSAQLGVIPLTAYYFREISLVGLLSNMLILPVIALVLGTGLAAAMLGLVLPAAGSILNLANYPLLAYIMFVTGKIGELPFSYREVFPPRIPELLFYYAFLLLLAFGGKALFLFFSRFCRQLRFFHFIALFLLLALILVWSGLPGTGPGELEVVVLDVGQGDAIFIQTPQGRNILLDGGGKPAFRGDIDEPGRFVVVPFLEYRRVKKLDMVIVSHPHEDHYGGLFPVLERFPVDVLVTNADFPETESFRELLQLAEKKNISREIMGAGEVIILGPDIKVRVLNPPQQLFSGTRSDINNNSLVLHLSYGEASMLFTGDIEADAVEYLLREEKIPPSQVLKVPHHGGYLPNLLQLLDQISPHAAVIPVGPNTFGHPHKATLSALEQKNVEIYRTDLHGAVVLRTKGYEWELRTMLPFSYTERPLLSNADYCLLF